MIPLPLRGLMLDAARLVESLDYYRRFVDFCADWEINAVIFRLTDDQGCAMRFCSHPELVTHANALTPAEVSGLAQYAAQRGVALIPEIESLGHSRYITRTAEHADLNDQDAHGPDWANALIPLHPQSMRILGDLYEEVADIFPSCYLHAGCDETNWGGSVFSRQLLATRSRAQVWGEHLNALQAKIQALGREMIVWDDMVLRHDSTILDQLDRRIILHDWEYAGTDPAPVASRQALAQEKGFRVLGGPALCWCKWGPRVGQEQLRNIDAYADVYRACDNPRALGVIVTNWVPSRYLQRAIWDGLSYAAVALTDGSARAQESALPRFVERHYGAPWDERWADVFTTVCGYAPTRQGNLPCPLIVPWSSDRELEQAVTDEDVVSSLPFATLLEHLDALEMCVRRNHADFVAFRLSVAYLAHLYWRHAAVRGCAGKELAAVLGEVARRDQALAAELDVDWRAGRSGDPTAGADEAGTWALDPEDRLHGQFLAAARFSAARARDLAIASADRGDG